MTDSLICVCTHDKSEHNTPTHGCGAEKCRCTFFRDKTKFPQKGSTTIPINAIEKVEIDESKLIERFKAKSAGRGKQNLKDKEKKIVIKTKEWDLDEKFESRITELGDDHEERLKEAEKWLSKSFENIDAWIQKGYEQYYLDKSLEALQTFDTALLLCNRNTDKKDRVIESQLIRIYKYKAWTWEDLKEYTEAIKCYKEILKITKDDVVFLRQIAYNYIQLSEYEEAQLYLETLLKIDPNDLFAIDNMGYCYQNLENYPKALEYYQRSNKLEKDEDDLFALERTTWVYWLQDDYDNALKYTNQLIERGTTVARVFYVNARVLIKQKKFDDAIISLQKSLAFNGIKVDLFFNLGLCYQNNVNHERFDLAILYYERSLKFDEPGRNRAITYSNIGICYGALKEYEKALSWFDKALQDNPTHVRSFIGKLEMYDILEKWNEVINSIVEQEAIDINETISVDCLKFNRDALIGLRKLDEALECSKKLLEKKKSVNIYCWHGWILSELDCSDDALKNFDMAIEIDREDEEGYRMKGLCLFDQKKYEDSIGLFQKAHELSTGQYQSVDSNLLRKGRAIKKIGSKEESKEKQKEAIAVFDEILKNDKNSRFLLTQAWIEKGHCYWNLRDYKKAEECYLKATELEPEDVSALIGLGDIARMRESGQEAIMFYDKALLYDKTNIEIYLGKLRAFNNLKQFSKCIKCSDEVLKLDEANDEAWFTKGKTLGRMDKLQRSIDHFEEYIEKFPDSKSIPMAWTNVALAQNILKKYPDALNSCEKAFKIPSDYWGLFEQKVRALIGLEKYPDAIIWLEKSLNMPGCRMKLALKELIKLNRRLGDIDKQKEYEKKLKDLDEGT